VDDDVKVADTSSNGSPAAGVGRSVAASPTVVDEAVLREAFSAMGGEMLGFARKSLYASGLADDAVQETFARAWRSRRRFDPARGTLRTWLFTIERRVVIDLLERHAKVATEELDELTPPAEVDDLAAVLTGWQVEAALDRLDEAHRRVIDELYFNGRTAKEVARVLGVPEGTVRSRAFYALRTLRLLLDEEGVR